MADLASTWIDMATGRCSSGTNVKAFADSFDQLIKRLEERRRTLASV